MSSWVREVGLLARSRRVDGLLQAVCVWAGVWAVGGLSALRLAGVDLKPSQSSTLNPAAPAVLVALPAGMLPLARELLKRGTHVIIAANSQPSINDITAAELEALLPAICQVDCTLCKGVSSQKLQVGRQAAASLRWLSAAAAAARSPHDWLQ